MTFSRSHLNRFQANNAFPHPSKQLSCKCWDYCGFSSPSNQIPRQNIFPNWAIVKEGVIPALIKSSVSLYSFWVGGGFQPNLACVLFSYFVFLSVFSFSLVLEWRFFSKVSFFGGGVHGGSYCPTWRVHFFFSFLFSLFSQVFFLWGRYWCFCGRRRCSEGRLPRFRLDVEVFKCNAHRLNSVTMWALG